MRRLILGIYDWLSSHKGVAALLLLSVMALCALSALRMDYQEDISAFLPRDPEAEKYSAVYEKLGGQEKIAVFFRTEEEDIDAVLDAMNGFCDIWAEADTSGIVPDLCPQADGGQVGDVFGFISSNWPYFLAPEDFARMDSLLVQPDYVRERLTGVRNSMYSLGSGMSAAYMRTDPLGLFTPVLGRLSALNPSGGNRLEDGCLFTDDGRTGIIFFDSPFGGSETGRNSELSSLISKVSEQTEAEHEGVAVFATGGPIVAVGNATRIKKDSILAVAIALILICLVLFLSFRRFADVFWIAVTIIAGSLFSIGIIALFKSSVSIIVLGIGSMIIGIAVNYPLHYVDHLKYQSAKRKALRDQVNPLLIGNITTVGAFLSLLLLKAEALHDFGFIGAMMLVGTILFVLIFLPVFVPEAGKPRNTIKLDWDRHLNPSRRARTLTFAAFLVVTAFLTVLSRRISFDSDMHHINYMTAEQSEGFEILSSLAADEDGKSTMYLVSEAPSVEDALSRADSARALAVSKGLEVRSIAPFCPSTFRQQEILGLWKEFVSEHPTLASDLRKEASLQGFTDDAFSVFTSLLENDMDIKDPSYFEPLTSTVGAAMYLDSTIVDYIKVDSDRAADVKSSLRSLLPEGSFCFDYSDVGSTLVSALSDDFDNIGLICSLIVFFFLWFSFRSIELSAMSFLPLAVSWVWILGMMQLLGLQFNIVNIILATFIFGQGDDYTIFITEGLMYERATGKKILQSYKNCVMLSALIMFIGIGALIVAKHPAMKSLAYVTIIGMFTVVVMAYYLPPLVFRWLTRKKGDERLVPVTLVQLLRTVLMLVIFLLAMLVFTPVAMLYFLVLPDSDWRRDSFHKAIQAISRLTMKFIPGAPFTTSCGSEDFSKPCVIVCNHQSHLDILALLQLTPKIVVLTTDWVWNNPFYGYLVRKAEFYPVSDGIEKNYERLKALVAKGYSIAVFPEGTRSEDCHIQRFHRGAFLLARTLGMDMVPAWIHGFGYALPKKDMLLRKAGMYLEVGDRIPASEIPEDVKTYTREFRHRYMARYDEIRSKRETPSYNAPFVKYQYLYKGEDAAAECRTVLCRKVFDEIAAIGPEVRTVNVTGSGNGVYALLLALSRRDIEVYAYESDEERHLTATRCLAVPDNLHHILMTSKTVLQEADKTIEL